MASFVATPDPARERLYRELTRRNRLVGVLRIALSDRSRDLAGRLRRLTAAANDVVLAWDRGAA